MKTPTPTPIPLILLLLITLSTVIPHTTSKTHWRDILVLKQLKLSISPTSIPPASCISTWDFTYDPCDHLSSDKFTCGFTCTTLGGAQNISRVTELALDSPGYSAQLAAVTWTLPFLTVLDLTGNNFSGPIPDSFSGLTRLTKLTLSRNSVSGPLPGSLGRLNSLEEIYLDNNALVGPIPRSFSGLVGLKRLELQGNKLGGELPDLSRLSSLYLIDLGDNSFSGGFPTSLPASLVEVSMRGNKLNGNLPFESVVKLGFLQVLDLSYNQLSGSIPASLFTRPSLQQLSLAYNNFTSIEVPNGFGAGMDPGLIAVDLSYNELNGVLPGFMGLMPKLSSLSLENNKLMGLIPTQYALKTVWPEPGIAQFDRLLLGGNYLFGPIPDPLMRMEPGSARVNLVDNCLFMCPITVFFCQGGDQKSLVECRNNIGPVIP
ncbi:uncharacterized protein LOC141623024 [Silene latifolia]|uniref:uncharacterized protein LOC141623024 n=1 Tax=Silene latifolia TaxID=37657 RepID=UPI003D785BBF